MKTNTDEIKNSFKQNYDPTYENYLNHKSHDDLCKILQVDLKIVDNIINFILQFNSEYETSYCKEFIQFTSNIPLIDKLLSIYFYDSIDSIVGNEYFYTKFTSSPLRMSIDELKTNTSTELNNLYLPSCIYDQTDPVCLKKLYNASSISSSSSKMPQAVVNYGNDYFSSSDLETFWTKFDLNSNTIDIINDNDESSVKLESTLDMEYITGMGNNIDTQFFHYTCTTDKCHPFYTMLMQMSKIDDSQLPKVLSLSVGVTEYEYLNELGKDYADKVNTEFMKLGLRGVSVIFAIGDRADQEYDGLKWINFPASSPYVTSVGGVWLGELHDHKAFEVDPMSTGGFSNYFNLPDYQKSSVESWVKQYGSEGPKNANYTKRAVPDLSAMSDFYYIVMNGVETYAGGTSASAPVVAGMVSLLNQKRGEKGKKSLGFLNPFLYKNSDCFEDVVGGKNLYRGVKGWDPASGLGTVDLNCLLERALKE